MTAGVANAADGKGLGVIIADTDEEARALWRDSGPKAIFPLPWVGPEDAAISGEDRTAAYTVRVLTGDRSQ